RLRTKVQYRREFGRYNANIALAKPPMWTEAWLGYTRAVILSVDDRPTFILDRICSGRRTQSGSRTRTVATESVSLYAQERKATIDSCLLATERAIGIFRTLLLSISLRG